MLNHIFRKKSSKKSLGNHDIAIAHAFGVEADTRYDESRISGSICACNGHGEFVLNPPHSKVCRESGERYMECRNCGDVAHL